MSRLVLFLIFLTLCCSLTLGQGTTVIQTPFGPKEIPAPATQPPAEQQAQPQNPGNVAAETEPQAGPAASTQPEPASNSGKKQKLVHTPFGDKYIDEEQ
jgi:hypothetical protein